MEKKWFYVQQFNESWDSDVIFCTDEDLVKRVSKHSLDKSNYSIVELTPTGCFKKREDLVEKIMEKPYERNSL